MSNQNIQPIKYGLLENSLDFISSALESLGGKPGQRELKYAVLHLSSGVELLFKERLRREHWALVFDRPENANKNKYETGDFTSVSFAGCLKRLVDICGIQISEEKKNRLIALRDKRNRLEHFGFLDTIQALTSDASAVMSLVLDFVDAELSVDKLNAPEKASLEKIRKKLTEFEVFVRERLKEIGPGLAAIREPIRPCPSCTRKAMVISSGASCMFCGYRKSAESAANDYIADVIFASGDDWPLYICPKCKQNTLVDELYDSSYICFSCATVWKQDDLRICDDCGLLFEGSSPHCSSCADHREGRTASKPETPSKVN